MKLHLLPTGGAWEVSLQPVGGCCPVGAQPTDTILVSTRLVLHGTLRKLLFVLYPKGVRALTVYVVRLNKQGERKMARPCMDCWKKLKEAGVRFVIYSTDNGWRKEKV